MLLAVARQDTELHAEAMRSHRDAQSRQRREQYTQVDVRHNQPEQEKDREKEREKGIEKEREKERQEREKKRERKREKRRSSRKTQQFEVFNVGV